MSAHVVRKEDAQRIEAPWGSLQWLVSGATGTGRHMTLGRVTIKPGQANPAHFHPNCDEILFVVQGEISHLLPDGSSVRLGSGDCIVIDQEGAHQARNSGATEAVVVVAFNTPDRQTVEVV